MIEIEWPVSQKICELKMLQKFFLEQKVSFKYVLEIGTFFGGTALLWAKMVEPQDGRVYSLDLFHQPNSVYRGSPWEKYIVEIDGDSHSHEVKKSIRKLFFAESESEYEKTGWNMGREIIDMLFLDGDHSEKGVAEDFYSYSLLVRDGGWVVFHDIRDTDFHRNHPPPPVEQCLVALLWEELRKKYEHWEFLDELDDTYMGLGVIRL